MLRLFIFAFVFLAGTAAFTQEDENYKKWGIDIENGEVPNGLPIGVQAPEILEKDETGREISLKKLLKSGPVVLFFYRGYWCPVCSKHLGEFENSLNLITSKGAHVIAVAPETDDNVILTKEKTGISFVVIPDTNGKIMKDYGVLFNVTQPYQQLIVQHLNADIAHTNGQKEARLPVPATYIIGQDGKIIWRHFDINYKNRASAEDIAEQL